MSRDLLPIPDREAARIGPRILKDPDSVEFAWQTLALLKTRYEMKRCSIKDWEEIEREAKEHKIYRKIPPEKPYGTYRNMFLAELGITPVKARARVVQAALEGEENKILHGEELQQARAEGGKEGGRGHKKPSLQKNNCKEGFFGNSAAYLAGRIAAERPDILDRMKVGEFRSVRAAAIEAGIIHPEPKVPQIKVPLEPVETARLLKQYFTSEQVAELIRALREPEVLGH